MHDPRRTIVLQADPKYRKYQAAVERSLALFESVAEWADFITFLAKLLKVRLVLLVFCTDT